MAISPKQTKRDRSQSVGKGTPQQKKMKAGGVENVKAVTPGQFVRPLGNTPGTGGRNSKSPNSNISSSQKRRFRKKNQANNKGGKPVPVSKEDDEADSDGSEEALDQSDEEETKKITKDVNESDEESEEIDDLDEESEDVDDVEEEESEDLDDEEEEGEKDEESHGEVAAKKQKLSKEVTKPSPSKEVKKDDQSKEQGKREYQLFVGNLPFKADKDDIIKHFSEAGKVTHVRLPVNPRRQPRGFGYIVLEDQASFEGALKMHHTTLMGREINVEYCKHSPRDYVNPNQSPQQKKKQVLPQKRAAPQDSSDSD